MGLSVADIARLSPSAQRQITQQLYANAEKLGTFAMPKPSKMRNVKVKRETITFDSKREAARYDELILQLRAGLISDLKLQPQLTIQESYITPDGERIRAIRYIADFSYFRDGKLVYEDAKGRRMRTYADKYKLVRERLGIKIIEV